MKISNGSKTLPLVIDPNFNYYPNETFVITYFFISNAVAKAPGLNFSEKLRKLLSNREALNK